MVAGLSTGSIIAMAMDFSIWPRYYTPPTPPQPASAETEATPPASGTAPTTELVDKVPDEESVDDSAGEIEPTVKDNLQNDGAPLQQKQQEEDESNNKQSTAIVNGVPRDSDENRKDSKSEEKKTSLVHPVPADEEGDGDVPKTILQTAQQTPNDASLE